MMKKTLTIIVVLLFPMILLGQNSTLLKSAQDLFAAGDYSSAVTKYKECVSKLSGRDRSIAQIQLVTAQACVTALSNAKSAESSRDYDKAITEYQTILDANPNDSKVKSLQDAAKKAKREANPTLSVTRSSLSFSANGGTEKITVNCSMTWTISYQSAQFCTITRNGNEISITATSNSSSSSRNMYFTVKTTNGVKEQTVSISQSGKSYSSSNSSSTSSSSSYTLTASPTNISVSSTSGTKNIYVTTNASSYEVDLLPNWCTVTSRYKTYFVLSYSANPSSSSRSDWFRVKAGGKTVRIDIKQDGSHSSSSRYGGYSGSTSTSNYKSDKLFRIGVDVSMDFFLKKNYSSYSYSSYGYNSYDYSTPMSFGIGLRARLGRYDQFFNLISGVRYVGGKQYSGVMIPLLVNMNLIRLDGLAFYLGGGGEFNVGSSSYRNDWMVQFGMCGKHADFQMYYKPTQEVVGLGFTYYF